MDVLGRGVVMLCRLGVTAGEKLGVPCACLEILGQGFVSVPAVAEGLLLCDVDLVDVLTSVVMSRTWS